MDILQVMRHNIDKYDLLERGSMVIVGVSGGPDSLCLLHMLKTLAPEYDLHLHVAHLNHQLRGKEAEADAAFVRDLARQWNLPCTIEARDVAAYARDHKLSIEEAARQVRYAFLIDVAIAQGSETIAVAHNADDQTESVLMHFLRGSGLAGLHGMLPKTRISEFRFLISDLEPENLNLNSKVHVVRPLLDVSRTEIETYCNEHGLQPRIDATNVDTAYFRNRLRHELLPLLETYNPNIRAVLRRMASVLAAEYEVLQDHVAFAWSMTVVDESDTAITFNLPLWREQALAARRALLREAIHRLRPPLRDIAFVHVEGAVDLLMRASTGDRVTLPQNLLLEVGYDTFTITLRDEPTLPDWPLLPDGAAPISIAVPGVTVVPESAWALEAVILREVPSLREVDNPFTAYLDAATLAQPLTLRVRTSSDRFHPQGMPTLVRLKDWMISAKVPRLVRDRLPLIEAGDQIVWVAGFRVGQPYIITPQTKQVLKLSFGKEL